LATKSIYTAGADPEFGKGGCVCTLLKRSKTKKKKKKGEAGWVKEAAIPL